VISKKDLLFIFGLIVLAKVFASNLIPVVGDETYYWYWGKNLRLSYFDHPPAVSWMTFVSNFFGFLPSWVRVRWPFILLSTGSVLVWLKCYQLQFNPNRASSLYFILFFVLNPMLGLGGIFATPDVPLIFFTGCSMYSVLKILKFQRTFDYILLGSFLGLGFCSKYHIVLFVPSILVFLYLTKQLSQINSKKLIATALVGLIFCSPVIVWNYMNNWESFAFQINHGFTRIDYSWDWTTSYLIGQILLFSPFLGYELCKNLKSTKLGSIALFQWIFFLYSSTKAPVEANWPIVAHTYGLLGINFSKIRVRLSLIYWGVIYFVLTFLILSPFGKEKIQNIPNLNEIRRIAPEFMNYQPLYGPSYQISSLIHYITGVEVRKLPGLGRYDFYDKFPAHTVELEKFYLLKHANTFWPTWTEPYSKTTIKKFREYNLELIELKHE
jgi:4-amino-4-deoxy-L-arabinose transferase-like glycosyltransferase